MDESISENMPRYEYKARLEEGRSDQEGDIKEWAKKQPGLKSVEVDELFGTDASYLDAASKATTVASKLRRGQNVGFGEEIIMPEGDDAPFGRCPQCNGDLNSGHMCPPCDEMSIKTHPSRFQKRALSNKIALKTVTAIDDDGVSAKVRRHVIDQHVGRVQHVGHAYKGNDVNFSANDMVYEDLTKGRKPNGASPYSIDYFVDKALRGMKSRDYADSNNAFRQVVACEEARNMSDFQKMRFAELLTGYGLGPDEDVVKKAMKDGNQSEKAQRAEEDVVKSKK